MPRRQTDGTPIFFALNLGVRTPAGYGISRDSPCGVGSKGANQKSYPHAYTLGVFKTLNLIQIKSVRADKQKPPVDGQLDSTQ